MFSNSLRKKYVRNRTGAVELASLFELADTKSARWWRSCFVPIRQKIVSLYAKPLSLYVAMVFIPCVKYDSKETADTSSKDHREVLM